MSATRARLSGLRPHDSSSRSPSTSFRGNEPWSGFSRGGMPGYPSSANPDASGSRRGGRRPAGDQSPPQGGLPPLGRYDDDSPHGSSDSRWLNE